MTLKSYFLILVSFASITAFGQNSPTGTGGGSTTGFSEFQNKLNLGYKAGAKRARKLQVDGTPYLFENWDNASIITTKSGERLKIKDVNFDGRRNKIVAKISNDSIYTFNSLAIDHAIINDKKFVNIATPDESIIKIYELIAETADFKILKDYVVEISGGSSNPMRGTIYSRYVARENYLILTSESLEKFSLKKKKILKLLAAQQEKVKSYVEEKDLSYKDEKDVNKIINYYTGL